MSHVCTVQFQFEICSPVLISCTVYDDVERSWCMYTAGLGGATRTPDNGMVDGFKRSAQNDALQISRPEIMNILNDKTF